MKKVFVQELPQFNGYGISDAEWRKYRNVQYLSFWLSPKDYAKLGCSAPKKDAPVIGVLFSREKGYYSIGQNYLAAVAATGAQIMLLDHVNYRDQIINCDALLLPGGAFASPEKYYTDSKTKELKHPSDRSEVYFWCIKDALKYGMPVLGICAGMQMLAGFVGMKLFQSKDCFESPLEHKSPKDDAHLIWLKPNTPFAKLIGAAEKLSVNSRHTEFVAPERVQREELRLVDGDVLPLEVYATATDGIPEAIGDMARGILCVQWHPEDLAVKGDTTQQKIFSWLYDEAVAMNHQF